MEFVPKKLYYKIREVCEIAGVEAHVLRFWETEFPALSPPKSKKGQRIYRPGDIELILEIRKLLYEDCYTIAGARKRLGMGIPDNRLKNHESKKKPHPSVNASAPVKPSKPEFLPLFDSGTAETTTTDLADFSKDFHEDEACTESEPFQLMESSPSPSPMPLDETPGIIPPKTDTDKHPNSERLKRVQSEVENILTLLDRE